MSFVRTFVRIHMHAPGIYLLSAIEPHTNYIAVVS